MGLNRERGVAARAPRDLDRGARRLRGLSEAEVRELVEYGALSPADAMNWTFRAACVARVRAAMRMRRDLELDTAAFALVVSFLERIGELESQVRDSTRRRGAAEALKGDVPNWLIGRRSKRGRTPIRLIGVRPF
jgi:hypothetical protein